MAKAPFTISKAPDLATGAANPAAGLMQATSWGGVQTDAHVVIGGGAKKTDNENVNKLLAVAEDPENDEYISNVVEYSDAGTVKQSNLRNLSDSRELMTVVPMLNCVLFAGGQDEKGFSRVVEMYDSFGGHKILTSLDVATLVIINVM